jgi:hypothetical protein
VLIGWTFGEFSKSPLWYWLPKYCAWFSFTSSGAFCTIFSTRAMVSCDTPGDLGELFLSVYFFDCFHRIL